MGEDCDVDVYCEGEFDKECCLCLDVYGVVFFGVVGFVGVVGDFLFVKVVLSWFILW